MFCPKCGDELVEVRGELTCVRGGMQLSQSMAARLADCFINGSRQPSERRSGVWWGGDWYCPGCGVYAPEEGEGIIRCPRCGRCLSEFAYELTERHSHARVGPGASGGGKLNSEKG